MCFHQIKKQKPPPQVSHACDEMIRNVDVELSDEEMIYNLELGFVGWKV